MSWPILLVEDDDELRSALFDMLSAQGYRVRTAANGLEALRRAHEVRPAVIVLDLVMPVMDGAQFLQRCSSDAALATIPVVLLTAQMDKAGEIADHAFGVLPKPLHLNTLLALIRQACDRPLGSPRRLPSPRVASDAEEDTIP